MTGDISEYDIATANAEPHGITAGPDGAVWFAAEADRIGRLVPNGRAAGR